MILTTSKTANINYLSKIVNISTFVPHPNPEVTRLKLAKVGGYTIVVGINEQPGLYIYFPTSSQINPELLSYANLYRHVELNSNPNATPGYFGDNGRVTAIKLKQVVSEGFLLPATVLQNFLIDNLNKDIDLEQFVNVEFDIAQEGNKEFWISKKFIIETNIPVQSSKQRHKVKKCWNKVIDTQFKFHYDTVLLRKDPYAISPDDIIHISAKWHGTSGISAYVLCKQQLNWKQKIAKWLTGEEFNIYDYIYSSRSVIKNSYGSNSAGFYNEDVWGYAHTILQPFLIKGMTLYYEIVGFLPSGRYIQKGYDYGCVPPTSPEDYKEGVNFKVYIYRITTTNVDGIVHEFSPHEVQIWCKNNGLQPVNEYYYGVAKDLYPDLNIDENWCESFMDRMADDPNFFMEKLSPDCSNQVPHEGIVIKKDNLISAAFKLKCFAFLNKEQKELDSGESNIEDNA